MNRDDIIRIARDWEWIGGAEGWTFNSYRELERFAALVAAAEREACAKVCDELQDVPATEPRHCAEDIRARGQA